MLDTFDLFEPGTLREALDILNEEGNSCKLLAGGTDLFVKMHASFQSPDCLIDLKGLSELKALGEAEDGVFVIGALTRHFEISRDPVLRARYTALAEGAESVGSAQIRHRGTVGGNICNAAPSGDTLGPLLLFGGLAVIAGAGGLRSVALEDFFLGPGRAALGKGEILKELRLPPPLAGTGSAYLKFSRRKAMDLALLGASAALRLDGSGCFDHVRVALTTAGPTPIRAMDTECLLTGRRPSGELFAEAGEVAAREARPRGSWRATEDYRREILAQIVPEALRRAAARAGKAEGTEREEGAEREKGMEREEKTERTGRRP